MRLRIIWWRVTFDRELEHNFGLIIAGKWRP